VKKIKEETTHGEWNTICDKDGLKMEYKNGVDIILKIVSFIFKPVIREK